MSIEIVVDTLVVRGLTPAAARLAATAFEAQLTALAASPAEIAARSEAVRPLPAVDVPAGSPAAVGEAVAEAVWRELGSRR